MSRSKLTNIVTAALLAAFFGIALYFRIAPVQDIVINSGVVKFTETDAFYHMRLIDSILRHFPVPLTFDPFTNFPHGALVPWPPMFEWIVAGIAWLVSLGKPAEPIVDIVAAYVPAFLGAATILPVYLIGKELLHRWAGIIAAGLLSVSPGGFLKRSILGFTDHHILETLFLSFTVLFLILALRSARQRQLDLGQLTNWIVSRRPLALGAIAGAFLGAYLLNWVGGQMLVFLLFLYFVLQSVIDHLNSKSIVYIGIVLPELILIGGLIGLPYASSDIWTSSTYLVVLSASAGLILLLTVFSVWLNRKGMKKLLYPLGVVVFGFVSMASIYLFLPRVWTMGLTYAGIIFSSSNAPAIFEMQPLLFPQGSFSFSEVWNNFTTGAFVSILAIGILVYQIIKYKEPDKFFLLLWSLFMIAATLGQKRFSYYLAVNVALLTGYVSWHVLRLAGFEQLSKAPTKPSKPAAKHKKPKPSTFKFRLAHLNISAAIVLVFFVAFFPNIGVGLNAAKTHAASAVPSEAWYRTLQWLKENTPEPFGDSNAYYSLYQPVPRGTDYDYPASAYGIMAWWDYGHWIERIARRIPVSNPFQQGAVDAARFFLADEETTASSILDKLRVKYVIVDRNIATGFLPAATFLKVNLSKYYDIYYRQQGNTNTLAPSRLFHPEYYRSLAARLYFFDGKKVASGRCTVITYKESIADNGTPYKRIMDVQDFKDYDAAREYVSKQPPGSSKVVGNTPSVSPVPLEEWQHFKLVFDSGPTTRDTDKGAVRVFEYIP